MKYIDLELRLIILTQKIALFFVNSIPRNTYILFSVFEKREQVFNCWLYILNGKTEGSELLINKTSIQGGLCKMVIIYLKDVNMALEPRLNWSIWNKRKQRSSSLIMKLSWQMTINAGLSVVSPLCVKVWTVDKDPGVTLWKWPWKRQRSRDNNSNS